MEYSHFWTTESHHTLPHRTYFKSYLAITFYFKSAYYAVCSQSSTIDMHPVHYYLSYTIRPDLEKLIFSLDKS